MGKFFIKNGGSVFDIFRPIVRGDNDVNYWYQQNVFLYIKNNSPVIRSLGDCGLNPVVNISLLDSVHFEAFENRSTFVGLLKQAAQNILPASLTIMLSNIKSRFLGN